MSQQSQAGRLVCVLGSTRTQCHDVLRYALGRIGGNPLVHFTRQVVGGMTGPVRPTGIASSETHEDSVTDATFEAMRRNDGLALNWYARDARRGFRRDLTDHLDAGKLVIVDGTAGAYAPLIGRFPELMSVSIDHNAPRNVPDGGGWGSPSGSQPRGRRPAEPTVYITGRDSPGAVVVGYLVGWLAEMTRGFQVDRRHDATPLTSRPTRATE